MTEQPEPKADKAVRMPADNATGSRWKRLRRAFLEDIGGVHFRLRLLHIPLFFLPPMSLARLRTALYRLCGFRIGANSLMLGKVELVGNGKIWEKLQIGEICQINGPLYADLNAPITIGHHVSLGHHVVLITTQHLTNFPHHRCGPARPAPIVIEDGCWIGARVTILPGVTIGKGSVVSAGAVVFADVPPHKVVGGNPARIIKSLSEEVVPL